MPTATTAAPLTQRQIYLVFAGLMTGISLSALDGTIVNTALTTIVGDLGGISSYTWVGIAYLLTSTAATPLFGKLSDLYGRKGLFQAAIITFVGGSLLCGMAQNMAQLVGARALQGVGGGGLMAMAFVIVGDVVPPRERGRYVGFFTSVFALASVAGPLLGGFFVEHLTWRWIFFINVPLGIVALVVTSRALRLPFARQQRAIDWWGAAMLVGSVSTLVLGLAWASERYGWTSAVTLGLLVGSAALTGAFVWWETRAAEPILPLRLFRIHTVAVVVPLALLLGAVMFGATAFMPLFLQGVTGVSPTASGLLLLPLMGGVTITSITTGRITARTGHYRRWPILGTSLGVIGLLMLTQLDDTGVGLAIGLVAMALLGAGMGATMPTSTLAVQNAVEWSDLGVASSLVTFVRSLGGVVGLAAFGAVFTSRISSQIDLELLRQPRLISDLPDGVRQQALDVLADGVTTVFLYSVPLMAGAFVLALLVKELPLRATSPMEQGNAEQAAGAPVVAFAD
jgi:EmrB/QacA subfamily drug resistance transporter